MIRRLAALSGLIVLASSTPLLPRQDSTNGTLPKTFKDIPPTADLVWTPCYENFTCVNLEVPLDYEKSEIGTTNVAFIRWETPNQPAMGDIIVNPGGPGGSGVSFILSAVPRLVSLLGTSYNFVGMDPRGVDNSGPSLDCFKGNPAARDYYIFTDHYAWDTMSPTSMTQVFADSGAFGEFCGQNLGEEANYANTPAVARDMLQYVELQAQSCGGPPETAKLDYYGVSYGSTLGATFAALYPDRVGHMILDGVMDVGDYYIGSWIPGIAQADEAVRGFCQLCFEAGPVCAFFRNDSDANAIQRRLDAILKDLEERPIPVSDPKLVQYPTVVTHVDLRGQIFASLYDSFSTFPILAVVLSGLEQRNASLLTVASEKGQLRPAECESPLPDYSSALTKYPIACTDQMGRYNISTIEKWHEYVDELEEISTYIGGIWARVLTLNCRSWQFAPPESQVFYGFNTTETSNPILFTGNQIDPVTSSTETTAQIFPGSGILKQNAIGHGVISALSNCTSSYLTKYMETGELPPPDTVCETDKKVFEEAPTVENRSLKRRQFPDIIMAH